MAVDSRIAIVLGSGNCADADYAAARALAPDAMIVACNHAARDYPGQVDHWASMHPDLFVKWTAERAAQGFPPAKQYWYPRHRAVHCKIAGAKPIEIWGGSSGLLCTQIALAQGADKVILAGVPLNQNFCHKGDTKKWTEARQYRSAWERRMPMLLGKVRSFSGWTAQMLGVPNQEWIDG